MDLMSETSIARELDLKWLEAELRRTGAGYVLLQAPLGLRSTAVHIAKALQSSGFRTAISSSNCWGGCDMPYEEAKALGVDTIIHVGHTPFMRRDPIRTIYLECRYTDPSPILELIPHINDKLGDVRRVGLAASLQWLGFIDLVSERLKEAGFETVTCKPSMFSKYCGQVLGCDYSSLMPLRKSVDAYLIIGSVFHGLGAALLSSKRTYAVDPHTQSVKELSWMREKTLRQRYANILAFRNSRRVGVLTSMKPGQARLGLGKMVRRLLQDNGYEAYNISTNEVDSDRLRDYGLDSYVNTACPRLSIEDQALFNVPLLLPMETLVALKLIEWEYVLDHGLLMYPWGWSPSEGAIFWRIIRGEAVSRRSWQSPEISCA